MIVEANSKALCFTEYGTSGRDLGVVRKVEQVITIGGGIVDMAI
jgi:hypothetical protein